jgi:integrase
VGSIYPRKNKLWIRFKGADGAWTQSKTPFHLGEDDGARKLLKRVESKIAAGAEVQGTDAGPLTLAVYARKWNEERSKLGLADWKNDEARLSHHVLPRLGSMPIDEIRPRHLADLFRRLRGVGKLAPKTIRNIYSAVMALFRDAQLADLIETSPCILTKYQLGENVDKDLAWRPTAIYTRAELEMLIADERIPWDRQVLYGLEGIAGLRHGEAAGLRWSDYDSTLKPLGRLSVWNSYATGRTKTKRARYMPVHPTLGAMLAEWRLKGWVEMMGRVPKPEDLIVPMQEGPRVELGKMRSKNDSYKRLCTDLGELGLRHRRGQRPPPHHDLAHAHRRRPQGPPRALHAHPAQAEHHRRLHGVPVGIAVRGGREAQDPAGGSGRGHPTPARRQRGRLERRGRRRREGAGRCGDRFLNDSRSACYTACYTERES